MEDLKTIVGKLYGKEWEKATFREKVDMLFIFAVSLFLIDRLFRR